MRTWKTLLAVSKCYLALALFAISLPASAVLYCYDSTTGTASTWYVGNKFYGAWSNPEYCYASGSELAYIRAHFAGLRMRSSTQADGGDVVTWFGDDADFIVNNL